MLAASKAFVMTFGLAVTFGGIGVVVNLIVVYIAVQVRGERRQNQEYLESRRRPASDRGIRRPPDASSIAHLRDHRAQRCALGPRSPRRS